MIHVLRKRANKTNQVSVWSELKKSGGYIIYAGVKGTDAKTYAGSAMSRETLEYNVRKAQIKFGVK